MEVKTLDSVNFYAFNLIHFSHRTFECLHICFLEHFGYLQEYSFVLLLSEEAIAEIRMNEYYFFQILRKIALVYP